MPVYCIIRREGTVAGLTEAGEEKAWEILGTLKPGDVCTAADVTFNRESSCYRVTSFAMNFSVSLANRTITSDDPHGDALLARLGDFFRLSLLWYLVSAKKVDCTGTLVKLTSIRGGEAFSKGSHVLPLEQIAGKYGHDRDGFIERGRRLGGEVVGYGDAAVNLLPFPRVPVVLMLWIADDEFPARADLLFDASCELQAPTDIIWSIAMMSVLMML
ncbi:MAG TPA: hypothetical protein DCO77_10225 [Nitrospiraceae bacterium]|nr:hypothetical protein [Nitrospiraceae bacterium]